MKQTTGIFAVLTAALFLGSMVGVGCGGDDSTTSGAGAGGSGGSAGTTGGVAGKGGSAGSTAGTAGTGGTAGSAGTAGKDGGGGTSDAGADAPDAPTTITCGTKTCGVVTGAAGSLQPCCPAGETNACGGMLPAPINACVTATVAPTDSSCPSVAGQVPLAGCCRANGMCGLSASLFGLGCADPSQFGGNGSIACGGDAGRPDATSDTGTTDTGTTDTGSDTGTTDTGAGDTGSDTGTTDTGSGDSAPGDATAG